MKKKLLAVLATSAIALAACGSDDVLVKSNVGDITESDFNEAAKNMVGDALIQQMMIEKVLMDKYKVTDAEVKAEVDKYKESYGDQFDAFMLQNSGSVESFEKSLKLSLLMSKAQQDIEISEEEIKNYYEKAKLELSARHILVATEEEAKEIKAELDKGGDFAKLAKEKSQDTGSVETGGDLGWFTVGTMVTEFNDAAYALEVGEISEPVQSEFGFHIIEVLDKKETDVGTIDEMKEEIKNAIAQSKGDATTKLVELLKDADIEVKSKDFENSFEAYLN